MAGISILLANVWLIFILVSSGIGVLIFLISMILLKRRKKNDKERTKKLPIITLIISLFFQIPLVITLVGMGINSNLQTEKKKEELDAIETKIIVQEDEWRNGFDYNGKHLVPVDIFMNSDGYKNSGKFKNLEEIGALVIEDTDDYIRFYKIKNNSEYDIYYVWVEIFVHGEYYPRTFVDEKDYNDVLEYYKTSNLSVSALWITAPEENKKLRNTIKSLDLDINDECEEIMNLTKDVLKDYSNKKQKTFSKRDGYDYISLKINSDDKIFTIDLDTYVKNDELIVYLNEYEVSQSIITKYKKLLLSLINESKKELLSGN